VSLAKRRGFIFPGSEIYGGLSGTWDYGPLGVELKNNIKQMWWKRFVQSRDDIVGIDSAIIMNPKVWEESGHRQNFNELLSECKKCHHRIRVDHYLTPEENKIFSERIQILSNNQDLSIEEKLQQARKIQRETGDALNKSTDCPTCAERDWTEARPFDLMITVVLGAVRDEGMLTSLRPETAQGMFVNFKNVLDTTRRTLPFGIAQIGKAFRNEITPRDFIFRSREFEQMEIEYFVRETEWGDHFNHWLDEMRKWIKDMGIDTEHVHELEVPDGERAHYSKRTVDFEYDFPFGKKELYGLAYRTDFDLKNHFKEPPYREEGNESFYPHVIEPTWGVDRTVLAILLSAYREEVNEKGTRVYLALSPNASPYKVAVFPLVANKEHIVARAREYIQC